MKVYVGVLFSMRCRVWTIKLRSQVWASADIVRSGQVCAVELDAAFTPVLSAP